MASLNCTSCGAPVEIVNRFSKVVVCGYCGSHLRVLDDGLELAGKFPKLASFPSIFSVGSGGTILGKPFRALGRLRYASAGAHFDEWFLDYDGGAAWFSEDDGTYTIYFDMLEAVDIPDPAGIRAGQNIVVAGKKVMIKEKGVATVESGEGELFYYQEPGAKITFLDGVAEGKKVSIEISENEVEVFTGRPLLRRDIVISG